jgi:hypothetical protein
MQYNLKISSYLLKAAYDTPFSRGLAFVLGKSPSQISIPTEATEEEEDEEEGREEGYIKKNHDQNQKQKS